MKEIRPTTKRSEIPLPVGLPVWAFQCDHVTKAGRQCKSTAMRGAMRCRAHARGWEYRDASLRYLVWCLAPQLAVPDPASLRYVGRALVWAHWKAYMENVSALPEDKRFAVISWMLEHYDDVVDGGWIKSNGTYVRTVPSDAPWPPAAALDAARQDCGLTRSETAALVGGLKGDDLRRLAQGFAWPESRRLMAVIPHLVEELRSLACAEPEQVRAQLLTVDVATGTTLYAEIMQRMRRVTYREPQSMESFTHDALGLRRSATRGACDGSSPNGQGPPAASEPASPEDV